MDPRLAIAMAALATSNATLGAEAFRSQNVITRQYALAALAQPAFPSWLPTAPSGDRALIYADFVNGNYWAAGAVQSVGSLFEQNEDWGLFDPAEIVPGSGLDISGAAASPVITAACLPATLLPLTLITAFDFGPDYATENWNGGELDIMDLPALNVVSATGARVLTPGTLRAYVDGIQSSSGHLDTAMTPSGVVSSNIYSDHSVGSYNGSETFASPTAPATHQPNSIGIAGQGGGTSGVYMTSITIYAAQPEADLPALSTP